MTSQADKSAAAGLTRREQSHSSMRQSIWDRIPQIVSVPVFGLILVGIWQLAITWGWVSEFVLPPPADVAEATWDSLVNIAEGGAIWTNLWITIRECLIGFVLAAAAGFFFGALAAETAFGRRVVRPFLVGFYAAPKVAFAPLFVAWFGFGMTPKVVMAALIAFFPLFVDTAAGLGAIDENRVKLFRSLRASRWSTFIKLKLPNALPFVFAGLKTASVLTVIGAIVGEFLGGGQGIGALLKVAASQLALDRVFAYVIILSAMAVLFYAVVDLAERKIVFWRRPGFIPVEA